MEMPKPGAGHAFLARFAGRWKGDEVLHPAPPLRDRTLAAVGEFRIRMGVRGFFLVSDYRETIDGALAHEGHGVYGFDDASGTFTMHWFDGTGGIPEQVVRGHREGDALRFVAGSAEFGGRYTYALLDPDTFTFRLELRRGGEGAPWTPFMEGTYRRIPG